MVLVEDRARLLDVELVLGLGGPRQRDEPVEVGARDRVLGRLRRHLAQPVELLVGGLAWPPRACPAASIRLRNSSISCCAVVVLAELLLDRLHLLAQVVLALRLADLVGDLRLDAARDLLQLDLARDDLDELLDAVLDVVPLEQADLLLDGDVEHRSGEVGQARRIAGAGGQDHLAEIVRDVLGVLHEPLELVDQAPHQRVEVDAGVEMLVERADRRLHERLGGREAIDADRGASPWMIRLTLLPFSLTTFRIFAADADAVHARGIGIVLGRIALRDDGDELALADDVVEEVERLPPADGDRHDRVREEHAVAERKDAELGRVRSRSRWMP